MYKEKMPRQLASLTNVYWIAPKEFRLNRGFQGFDHHLGFVPVIPEKVPRGAGLYFGENASPDRRELVFTPFTTLHGRIPPRMSAQCLESTFKREKYVVTV